MLTSEQQTHKPKQSKIRYTEYYDLQSTSFGMAIAFFLPVLLPFPWFRPITPYLDQIITVTLSIFMPL